MVKNRKNKRAAHDKRTMFPTTADLVAALGWWREKIRQGFPPLGADMNLRELAEEAQEPELRDQFVALEKAVGEMVSQGPVTLSGAPRAAGQVTLSPDRKKIFVSSATGGISCHGLPGGSQRWAIPSERAFQVGGMVAAGKNLYYTDSWNGRVHAVNAADGSELWCVETASDNTPLLSPAGITLLEFESRTCLLLCDSSSHRLCTFTTRGKPFGVYGTRGLVSEETAHLNTAPSGDKIPQYFEFPRAVVAGTDFDNKPAIYVWDSGNGRVVVLDSEFNRKRNIPLVAEDEVKPRLSGQVLMVFGQSGPAVLVVDDAARTLELRGCYGEQLLTIGLDQLTAGGRTLETVRIETGSQSGGELLLASGNGKTCSIRSSLFDTRSIAYSLLSVFPEDCNLVLTGAPHDGGAAESWTQLSPSMDPSALVRCLCGGGKQAGELKTAAGRIIALANLLASGPLAEYSSSLRLALESQLEEMRSGCLIELERLATPSARDIESWSDALCEVDMEVFQSRGRSSSAELTMDALLEQVREIRPNIRRCGWKLREVNTLLVAKTDKERIQIYSSEMLEMLVRLLDKRLATLSAVAGRLEYDRDPQRVNRNELQTAHAARLQVSAIEGAAAELADELARMSNSGQLISAELTSLLKAGLEKSSGLECHVVLSGITGGAEAIIVGLPQSPELNGSADETFATLVEKMGAYLKQVQAGANGPQFGKVLERQKNLFSVKASLLANYYQVNGHGLDLLEKARSLAGDSWDENRNLRPAAPALEAES